VTGNAWEIERIIERYVARVVVVSPCQQADVTFIRRRKGFCDRWLLRRFELPPGGGLATWANSPDDGCLPTEIPNFGIFWSRTSHC
jgi:hypothetical protein